MSETTLAFILAFSIGCLMALVRHPVFGLITYIAVFYLHPPERWWGEHLGNVRWSLLAALFTLIGLLVHKVKPKPIPVLRQPVVWGLAAFVVWMALQSVWVLDPEEHHFLLGLYAKYLLLVIIIYLSIDTRRHLSWVLWAHVIGCFYLGWDLHDRYRGGRFEGFAGPGIDDSNTGALQIVTGILVASSLLLAGRLREKLALLGMIPFIVNALVATISRSGFLAALVGGLTFNLWIPPHYRRLVRVLSALAVVLLLLLSNPDYWQRIATIKLAGQEVESVDTGASRLRLIEAQWKMFESHPLGCGHRCTAVLSPSYLDARYLSSKGGRSSHNTFMTMLVEHGIPGAVFYAAFVFWLFVNLRRLGRSFESEAGLMPVLAPSVAGVLVAIVVGDLFVDYLKFEARFWFVAILMVMLSMRDVLPLDNAANTRIARPHRPQADRAGLAPSQGIGRYRSEDTLHQSAAREPGNTER